MADPAALRAHLKVAIEKRREMHDALDVAIAAQRRGEQYEQEAQARYDKYADLDDRIIDLRSAELCRLGAEWQWCCTTRIHPA
jgi:hypothetical protein